MYPLRHLAAWVCRACGTQYAPSSAPPAACPICLDEREYVPPVGQAWTSLVSCAAPARVTRSASWSLA